MRQIYKITVGALLLTLVNTAYSQTSSTVSDTNSTPAASDITSNQPSNQGTQQSASAKQTMQIAQNKNLLHVFTPDNLPWKDASALPPGAQMAILEGNPKAKGNTTVRFKLPANFQVPPAYLQSEQRVTVLSGNMNIGLGDKLDTNAGTALPAGSFVVIPANKHHYVWTTDETIVQVSGTGPIQVKYVNPKDDPRRNKGTQGQAQPTTTPTTNTGPATGSQTPAT